MIMAILWPRYSRISRSGKPSRLRSLYQTSPSTMRAPGLGTSRIKERQVIVLPLPDSPTNPTASPCLTV